MSPFTIIVAVLWTIFIIYWIVASAGKGKKTKHIRQTLLGGPNVRFLLVAIIILLWTIPAFKRMVLPEFLALRSIGVFVMLIGLAFAVWARQALGANWSASPAETKEGHELIISGPYHFVRHPIYTGEFLALLGSVLADGKLRMLILAVITGIGLAARAKLEEKIMEEEFGKEYDRYKEKVKMLVPGIF